MDNRFFIVYFLLCLLTLTTAQNWKLIFEDNFNTLDFEKWQHEITMMGGGNWEFQIYNNNRSTSFTRNGVLYLKPVLTEDWIGEAAVRDGGNIDLWGGSPADMCTGNMNYGCYRTASQGNILNPIMSARIRTVNSFSTKYGKIEIRAQLPKGDWLWPAIWMLPKYNEYGGWPASGEIDILESRGNKPGNQIQGGYDMISSALHWGPHWPSMWHLTYAETRAPPGQTFADNFFVITCEWTPDYIRTFVNGQPIMNIDTKSISFWERGKFSPSTDNPWAGRPNNAPFDKPFYIIMNLAVGGTGGYFADGIDGKPWSNTSPRAPLQFLDARGAWLPTWDLYNPNHPSALKIDYVRVYCDHADPDCEKKSSL